MHACASKVVRTVQIEVYSNVTIANTSQSLLCSPSSLTAGPPQEMALAGSHQ